MFACSHFLKAIISAHSSVHADTRGASRTVGLALVRDEDKINSPQSHSDLFRVARQALMRMDPDDPVSVCIALKIFA